MAEFLTIGDASATPPGFLAPVLLVTGGQGKFYCGVGCASEASISSRAEGAILFGRASIFEQSEHSSRAGRDDEGKRKEESDITTASPHRAFPFASTFTSYVHPQTGHGMK